MAAIPPPSITALPTPPDPNDRATFNTRAYPWSVAQQTLATEVGAVATNVFDNATEAATAASTAATQAELAATSKTNADAAAALANNWATKTDGPVSGGEYSAKKYAQDAAATVATIPEGTINDATTSLVSVWSSTKVAAEIAGIPTGSSLTRSARTSNTILGAADKGKLIDITSGAFSQTFDAVATLGDGWWCYLRNSGTGVVTLDPNAAETIDGVATKALDPGQTVIVQCDGSALRTIVLSGVGNHVVRLDTGNGMGSTNTKIRRFTTTTQSVGTAITYADSDTAGASFTINETGLYSVSYTDLGSGGGTGVFGLSVNSGQLTTSVTGITAANRLSIATSTAGGEATASGVFRFVVGDVVRAHNGGPAVDTSAATASFTIRKVGI